MRAGVPIASVTWAVGVGVPSDWERFRVRVRSGRTMEEPGACRSGADDPEPSVLEFPHLAPGQGAVSD